MLLTEIFERYGYINVLQDDNFEQYGFSLKCFTNGEGKMPEELISIFMSKERDELFVVLDGRTKSSVVLCKAWDGKISFFLNHCIDKDDDKKKLEFNVVQIVLYDEKAEQTIDKSVETELWNSRKIMVKARFKSIASDMKEKSGQTVQNESIDIDEKEKYILPFVLVEQADVELSTEEKKKLYALLPQGTEFDFMDKLITKKPNSKSQIVMSLSDMQYKIIEGWIKLQ